MPTAKALAAVELAAWQWEKSGEGEIRTLDTLAGIPVFETGAFGHSATSPSGAELYRGKRDKSSDSRAILRGAATSG